MKTKAAQRQTGTKHTHTHTHTQPDPKRGHTERVTHRERQERAEEGG